MPYNIRQQLKAHETPEDFPRLCPECGEELFHASDYRDALYRELYWEYRYCPVSGWFDLIYAEWGNMGNFEESSYIQGHVCPKTISDLEESLAAKFWTLPYYPPSFRYPFPSKFTNSTGEAVVLTVNGVERLTEQLAKPNEKP